MGLDKVVEEILRSGEEKSKEIVSLGEKDRDDQILQAERRIANERAKAEKQVDATIAQMEQQELSSAELESKKALLAAQRKVLDELREQVLRDLEGYSPDKRERLYSRLVLKARKELGECYVYSKASDKALLRLSSEMSYAGSIECRGGLVFESKDRSFRLDYRFESMLDDVWNRNIQEIYRMLFG